MKAMLTSFNVFMYLAIRAFANFCINESGTTVKNRKGLNRFSLSFKLNFFFYIFLSKITFSKKDMSPTIHRPRRLEVVH